MNNRTEVSESMNLPLCRAYLIALFGSSTVQVKHDELAPGQVARWALGFLADGQREVLGLWLSPPSNDVCWQDMFADLKRRGVESIRLVDCSQPTEVRTALGAAYPGSAALPSVAHLLGESLALVAPRSRAKVAGALGAVAAAATAQAAHDALDDFAIGPFGDRYPGLVDRWSAALEQLGPFHALAPHLQRIVRSGDDTVHGLHQSLSRAVARRGSFPDRGAAISFLAAALRRAERGLQVRPSKVVPVTQDNRQCSGIRSSIGALGF